MLVLINADNVVIDQMNWGMPDHGWANYAVYSAGIWEPGVADVGDGHMLARAPTGFDTDSVSNWHDLSLPTVAMVYPVGGEVWYVGHTYNIQWTATNPNGPDSDLKISLYYSNDSGHSWATIAEGAENNGIYNWHVPLFLDDGRYYVPSSVARIKVAAIGPENFMVQAEDESGDFCPPIDYDALSLEDQQLVDQLIISGVIDESEVIRGGVEMETLMPELIEEIVEEEIATTISLTTSKEIIEETIEEETGTSTLEIIKEDLDMPEVILETASVTPEETLEEVVENEVAQGDQFDQSEEQESPLSEALETFVEEVIALPKEIILQDDNLLSNNQDKDNDPEDDSLSGPFVDSILPPGSF
jgi:hypothetical protein